MREYGLLPREVDQPFVRKGDYGRYGHSKNHRASYKRSERAVKRRERNSGKRLIQEELAS